MRMRMRMRRRRILSLLMLRKKTNETQIVKRLATVHLTRGRLKDHEVRLRVTGGVLLLLCLFVAGKKFVGLVLGATIGFKVAATGSMAPEAY